MIIPEPLSIANRFISLGTIALAALGIIGLVSELSIPAEPEPVHIQEWNFDTASPGSLPGSFMVGTLFDGRPAGEWKILITDRAKSAAQVLAQMLPKGMDQTHKLLLVEGTDSDNIDLNVSYLAVSGKADLGGGLVWHATDDRTSLHRLASTTNHPARLRHQSAVRQCYALSCLRRHPLKRTYRPLDKSRRRDVF